MLQKGFILIALLIFVAGCGGGGNSAPNSNSNSGSTGNPTPPPSSPSQDSRVLGMAVTSVPSVTYDSAYAQAINMGVREVSVSLDWASLEPTLGNYNNTLPAIIEAYYPVQQAKLTLVLRPLDTPGQSMPAELVGKPYDDAAVIKAFDNFLTNLHGQLTTLNASGKLKWIYVGNEIDSYLGSDTKKWAQWTTFFNAAKAKIKSLWGSSVTVSSIVQFSTLVNTAKRAEYLKLLPKLDSAVLTYYPLKSDFTVQPTSQIATDFTLMTTTISTKNIILQECGYPSGITNNSSDALQAEFITAVFNAWDSHRTRISLVDFSWQYDISEATADAWVILYGMSGQTNAAEFKSYLWTLGLNHYDSTPKPAFGQLKKELALRGWVK